MNREEILDNFDNKTGYFFDIPNERLHIARSEFMNLLDECESRTCLNCIYYEETENLCWSDVNGYVQESFGCNNFERIK